MFAYISLRNSSFPLELHIFHRSVVLAENYYVIRDLILLLKVYYCLSLLSLFWFYHKCNSSTHCDKANLCGCHTTTCVWRWREKESASSTLSPSSVIPSHTCHQACFSTCRSCSRWSCPLPLILWHVVAGWSCQWSAWGKLCLGTVFFGFADDLIKLFFWKYLLKSNNLYKGNIKKPVYPKNL